MIIENPHLIRTDEGLPDDVIWVAVVTDGGESGQQKLAHKFANRIARVRGLRRASMVSSGATCAKYRDEYRYGYVLR